MMQSRLRLPPDGADFCNAPFANTAHRCNHHFAIVLKTEFRSTESGMATQRKIKVLFVCIHNSARSQMAEAFLNQIAGDRFEAQSAGLEPGTLNPLAVEVMKDLGVDISANRTNSVFDFFKNGSLFDYVITVCDGANAERCPVFPGVTSRVHWSFADPAAIEGEWEHRLAATRLIRDEIRSSVISFINQYPVE